MAKFYAQGLVSVLAQGLVSFMFSWSEVELALVSDPRCVFSSGPFLAFGLQFQGQGMLLPLALVAGPKCVSLALVSGSGWISLDGPFTL